MNKHLDWALTLFDEGYAIFPVMADGKAPLVKWTVDYATGRDQVEAHWDQFPKDNIGINCLESCLLVVDLDGDEAVDLFDDLWNTDTDYDHWMSYTRCSKTPNRGFHVWFDLPTEPVPLRNTESMLGEHIDTRGAGGLIVAPGSEIDGRRYKLVNTKPVATCPDWLESRLRSFSPPLLNLAPPTAWTEVYATMMLSEVGSRVAQTLRGRRNAALNREAWRMRSAIPALGYEQVEHELLMAAEQAGLGEYEARRTIRSGLGC